MNLSVSFPFLTVIIFLPLIGALALMFMPREEKGLIRNSAMAIASLVFFVSLGLLAYDGVPNSTATVVSGKFPTMAFVEQYNWIESIGVTYLVGMDGISLWLVMLTTFLTPIVILSTYTAIDDRVKEFMICFLLLETGMLGALLALDAFLFYVFWELMLVPMYFMIGIWGGPRRHYATVKFFLYTMIGSLLMLVGILYIYFSGGGGMTFSLADMLAVELSSTEQMWLFAAFALAFAIKVPLFPFHTWLPDAHVQAPTAGSVILAGVLLKMGTYGLLRYGMPLFPEAVVEFAPWVALLAVIGIIYGALVAMVQKDIKKLVAYSSVSHLGFCVLGLMALTPMAIEGSIYVMLAHGIATGGLFLAVGVIYERRHTRLISEFGGLTKVVPVFATFFMIIVFTSAGLPGLAGFIGEFLVIVGTTGSEVLFFKEASFLIGDNLGPETTSFIFAALAATGVIFGAVYLLWMFQRVMFGPLKNPKNEHMKDLSAREVAYFIPIIIAAFALGLFPEQLIMNKMHTSVDAFMDLMQPGIDKKVTQKFKAAKNAAATVDFDKAKPRVISVKPNPAFENAKKEAEKKARESARTGKNREMPAGKGRTMRKVSPDDRVVPRLKPGTNLKLNPGFQKIIKQGAEKARKKGAGKAKQGGDP